MVAGKLDAIIVSSFENRLYLSGFTGSSGLLFITNSQLILGTDSRYVEQASNQSPNFNIKRISAKLEWLSDFVKSTGARQIGFEANDVSVNMHQSFLSEIDKLNSFSNDLDVTLVPTSNVVEEIRQIKDQDEIIILEEVSNITDQALETTISSITPGMTETELAWLLEQAMRNLGAEKMSFDLIVGAGPNGALPHHRADSSVIKSHDAIVIDMGCVYKNYCSDLTRTIFVDDPDERFKNIYKVVLEAQIAAENNARAGMSGAEIDALARSIIVSAGFGEYFGHSLGHGIGLQVHEQPWIAPTSTNIVETGMVFTIEPGIYIPGVGGVRIEDVVVMEEYGVKVLSKATKMKI